MKRIISFLVIMILLFTTVTFATSQSLNDAKNKQNNAQAELNDVKSEKSSVEKEIDKLNNQIKQFEDEISKLTTDINNMKTEVDKAKKDLDDSQKKYDETEQLFTDRMVALYETGETSYLDVLLSSSSLTDFISNYYLITELATYDTQLLDEIEKEKQNLQIAKNTLEQKQKDLEQNKASKESTQASLQASKDMKNSYMGLLNEKQSDLQAKVEQYDKDVKAIEAEIARNSGGNTVYAGGQMEWPTPGYYTITSPYGMRLHPIYGTYRMHSGIDIGAPGGAPILAANDGKVITATYSSSYGNYVIIDHGGGIMTLYAHSSQLLVSAGQTVSRGSTIAKVGSTGASTGNHLHFEVRINGSTTNPVPYVK